jgi:hypothetical protein
MSTRVGGFDVSREGGFNVNDESGGIRWRGEGYSLDAKGSVTLMERGWCRWRGEGFNADKSRGREDSMSTMRVEGFDGEGRDTHLMPKAR